MKTLLHQIAVVTAGTALSLGAMNAAQGASFNFSYTLENGDILSGMLEGEVQDDGDTVFVSEIIMPSFNGVLGPELPFVQSVLEFDGGPAGSPTVSFSGLVMDIIVCDSPPCSDDSEGFVFDSSGAFAGTPAYLGSDFYGDNPFDPDPYDPNRWQLTEKVQTSVPEPASILGLLAVGTLGAASKLKKKAEH